MNRITLTFLCCSSFCLGWSLPAQSAERPVYTCYRLAKAPVIDGDLSDWPQLPVIFLGRQDQVSSGDWKGPEDCHATIRLGWDDKALYLAVELVDSEVIQNLPDESIGTIFLQDCIQWAVDFSGTGTTGYDGDDYEYGFGRITSGPCVYRWHVSSSGLVPGKVDQVPLAVKRTAGGLIYEAAVPYEQLLPFRPSPNQKIGFTILAQDLDTSGHKTIEWTPGISCGKTPSSFGYLLFSPATAASGAGNLFISGQSRISSEPVTYEVIPIGVTGPAAMTWTLTDARGKIVVAGKKASSPYQIQITPRKLASGSYVLAATITPANDKPLNAGITLERVNVEAIAVLQAKLKTQIARLRQSLAEAKTQKLPTAYAAATLTVAELFQPFIEEDVAKDRKALALRNLTFLTDTLDRQLKAVADPVPVPAPSMAKVQIRNGEFYAGAEPMLLVGTMSWLWETHHDRDKFAKFGFNTIRSGMEPANLYDAKGQLGKDTPWWAQNDIYRAARGTNLALVDGPMAEHIWQVLARRGQTGTLDAFHKEYTAYLDLAFRNNAPGNCFAHCIAVEGWRPSGGTIAENLDAWHNWLQREYATIANYNARNRTAWKNFAEVPAPDEKNLTSVGKYDVAAFSHWRVANQIKWSAQEVRRHDRAAYITGYPTLLMYDDASDFYDRCDPELDLAVYDLADSDTCGSYTSTRYALATTHWLAMYRDLVGGLAPGKPQCDGEFHFVNERREYPAGFVPAIHFQAYVHGLSASYGWVWCRSDSIDSSILLEARVCHEYSKTALDLRRLAPQIIAFHKAPTRVAYLFSLPSTRFDYWPQTRTAYEGLFFDGVKQTFITERRIENGDLKDSGIKLLIVPAASHVSDRVVEQVTAFANRGGTVLLVGDCFTFDHRSARRTTKPVAANIHALPALSTAADARKAILPWVQKLNLLPPVTVKTTGNRFPVVEWRYANDGSQELLYLLNIGHTPATVQISKAGKPLGGTDLLTGNHSDPAFSLDSLGLKILKLSGRQ